MLPLVVTVMTLVSPYLVKGAEEFAAEAGKDAYDGVKALVGRLSAWWSDKPAAKAAAESMAQDPEENAAALAGALEREIGRNPALAADLQALVDKAAPYLGVVQKMKVADGVTGVRIEEFTRGTVSVDQTIDDAKNVIGAHVTRLG